MLRFALPSGSAPVLAWLALVCLAPSCGRLMEPEASRQPLAHVVSPPHVQLTNQTSKPIFFTLMDERIVPLVNWTACADAVRCPSLAPGASTSVEFDRIVGYSAESERAVLYGWHADGAHSGIQRPERIRRISVQLR